MMASATAKTRAPFSNPTSFVSASNGGSQVRADATWTGLSIPAGGSASVHLDVRIDSGFTGTSIVDDRLDVTAAGGFGTSGSRDGKWAAAAAVLADPALTSLTYVDVRVPQRPAVGGTSDPSPATTPVTASSAPTTAVTGTP